MISIELCKPKKGEYIPPRNLKGVSKEELDNDIANLSTEEWQLKYNAHWEGGIDDTIPLMIQKKYNKRTIKTIKDLKTRYREYISKVDANTIVLPYERTMRTILDIDPLMDIHISTDKIQINRILDNIIGDDKLKEEVNREFEDGLIFYVH